MLFDILVRCQRDVCARLLHPPRARRRACLPCRAPARAPCARPQLRAAQLFRPDCRCAALCAQDSALDAGSAAYWKALQPHRKLDQVMSAALAAPDCCVRLASTHTGQQQRAALAAVGHARLPAVLDRRDVDPDVGRVDRVARARDDRVLGLGRRQRDERGHPNLRAKQNIQDTFNVVNGEQI